METNDERKFNALLKGNEKLAVLFMANWCPFCRDFKPIFESEIMKLKGWTPILVILDAESNPLWSLYDIDIVPTIIYFRDGKVTYRLDGMAGVGLGKARLVESFEQVKRS